MIHPDMAGVKKASIKTELAKKFKCQGQEERIAVFGLKLKFGGGRTTAFATIFDDLDARKKYDSKDNLRRDGLFEAKPGKMNRKMAKEIKGKRKRVKGTAKSKEIKGKRKRVKGTA